MNIHYYAMINVLRNKHLKAGLRAVAKFGCLYTPPSSEGMRVKYAGQVGQEVEERITTVVNTSKVTGGTVCDDGWKDCARKHMTNGTFVSPEGAVFIRSKDLTGVTKDADTMAKCIIELIEEVGPETVAQVVTDNAAVMVAARRKVREKFPHVTCSGCAAGFRV